MDAGGNIYVAGAGSMLRFSPTGAPAERLTDCQTNMLGVTAHPNGGVYAGASTGLFVFGEGGAPCGSVAPARLVFEGDEGVTINGGAQYTNDALVQLTVEPAVNTTELRLSNDGGFQTATTTPVDPGRVYAWTLDSSGPERLPKTVYVRFANEAETSSQNFTDDIILDQTEPTVTGATLDGGAAAAAAASSATSGSSAARRKRRYKLRVRARDNASGVATMQITRKKRRPGKLRPYRKRITIKAKRPPRVVRVHDGAGNRSRWRKIAR